MTGIYAINGYDLLQIKVAVSIDDKTQNPLRVLLVTLRSLLV